jgi:hypothetical protein
MPSFRATALATAAVLVAAVQADYYVDPDSVPIGLREVWCRDEKSTCPLICQQTEPPTTLVNECDPETLTYGCLCGNNQQPNVSEYSLTLPFFVCQEWGQQCVKSCGGVTACQSACVQDNPCGAKSPKLKNETEQDLATGTSSLTAPTPSQTDDTTIYYPDGQDPSGTSNNSNADEGSASALEIGRVYGLAIVLGSMFAGFALL